MTMISWASLIAQLVKICLQFRRPQFDSWVGKFPWRRERLPTPVFWPGEFHGLYSLWGCKESDMAEWFSLSWYAPICGRVQNAVLGGNLKKERMTSVHFHSKPFNIRVIQVYAPTTDAKEAEVEWFYEDLQDFLELIPPKKTSTAT